MTLLKGPTLAPAPAPVLVARPTPTAAVSLLRRPAATNLLSQAGGVVRGPALQVVFAFSQS